MKMIEKKLKPIVFNWQSIPANQNDTDSLTQYLIKNFELNWIENQNFKKTTDNQTIEISNGGNSASITLNKHIANAILKINRKSVYEFALDVDRDQNVR